MELSSQPLTRDPLNGVLSRFAIHTAKSAGAGAGQASLAESQPSAEVALHPEMVERRVAALRTLFPYMFGWLASRNQLAPMHRINDYFSQATDLDDLERRIRRVQQRS